MLKFGKNKQISLHLSEKEKTLTKDFLFALSIACCVHLFAFFLFRLSPLMTKGSKIVLAPVQANAEIREMHSLATSDLESVRYKKIPEFPEAEPEFPEIGIYFFPPEEVFVKEEK